MRKLKYILPLLAFLASPVFANDTPSDESIKQLLEITEARKLADNMTNQLDRAMKNAMQRALQGHPVTPEQQKVIDRMQSKTVELVKEDLNWNSLESLYVRIYRDSFTQEDIDGMLALYQTPAGQALIKKMPIVMQRSMAEMQTRMGPLMQKLQKIQQEALKELKAQSAK